MGQNRAHEKFRGEVAKWLGNGLQNRYTRVRIPSSPPQKPAPLGGFRRIWGPGRAAGSVG